MPSFSKNNVARTPFGRNEFRRSTKAEKFESYTCAQNAVPSIAIDGDSLKVLQPGTVMAKITSGLDIGKVGVFQAGGTDEVQTVTKAGTWTSGPYKLTLSNGTTSYTTANIDLAAVAATVQAAIALVVPASWGVTVAGGPLSTTPLVITFDGAIGFDYALITVDTTGIVGGGTATAAETTKGVVGATDGRQTTSNIVGINGTFLPWTLLERDCEVAVEYDGAVVQAWCIEYNAAGAPIALTNTTRDAIVALPNLQFDFE